MARRIKDAPARWKQCSLPPSLRNIKYRYDNSVGMMYQEETEKQKFTYIAKTNIPNVYKVGSSYSLERRETELLKQGNYKEYTPTIIAYCPINIESLLLDTIFEPKKVPIKPRPKELVYADEGYLNRVIKYFHFFPYDPQNKPVEAEQVNRHYYSNKGTPVESVRTITWRLKDGSLQSVQMTFRKFLNDDDFQIHFPRLTQ